MVTAWTSAGSVNLPASSATGARCDSGSSTRSLSAPHDWISIMCRNISPTAPIADSSVTPLVSSRSSPPNAAAGSLPAIASTISAVRSSPGVPRMRMTSSSPTVPPPAARS